MTRRRRPSRFEWFALILLGIVVPCGSASATLTGKLARSYGERLGPLADSFGREVGRSLPVISASPGLVYDYDFTANVYRRRLSLEGEAYVEGADTVGKGHWNFKLAYQYVHFDRFGGRDLRDLSDRTPIVVQGGRPVLSVPATDIDVAVHEATAALVYGVTDRLDVSLAVPLIASSLDVDETIRVFKFEGGSFTRSGSFGDASTGIGDIVLRSKLTLLGTESLHASAGLLLSLPSGSKEDFQGVGSTAVEPSLFVSYAGFDLGRSVALRAHVNLSMLFDADDVSNSEGRWGSAIDLVFGNRGIVAVALLGRHAVGDLFPSSAVSLPRRGGPQPLFGFDGSRPDYVDLSIGGRLVVWRDSVIAFANVRIPLLDRGLVTDPIPLIGIEVVL